MDILNSIQTFETNNQQVQNNLSTVKLIGIYFSAHWCPPCKSFTPVLAKFYNEVNQNGKVFEVVFATADSDEDSFRKYLSEMPWVALPFGDSNLDALSNKFSVSGIPRLVIMKPDGTVVNENARGEVTSKGASCFNNWLKEKVTVQADFWVGLENGTVTEVVSSTHSHPLKFVDHTGKSNALYAQGWGCNECGAFGQGSVKNLYCSVCSYDLCRSCYQPNL